MRSLTGGVIVTMTTVSQSALKEIIDKHECVVNGVVHHFKVKWAAPEPRWTARRGDYAVAVQVLSDNYQSTTVHLMVPRSTPRNVLLKLLVDAVQTSSSKGVTHGG